MPARLHTKWPIAVVIGLAGTLLVTLVVLAFLWPTKTLEAHDLPVGIVGPDAAVTAIEDAVADNGDAIDFVAADDRDAALAQIRERQTYGAIVLSASAAPEVLTAPAASTVAAQALAGLAGQLQAQLTAQAQAAGSTTIPSVTTTVVVPLADTDPTGSGLTAAAFPLAMGGMLGGVIVSLLVIGPIRRLAALGAYAVASGLVLTVVLQTWFGFIQGQFLLNAAAVGLILLGTSAFIVGCASLVGRAGIGIGAVLTLLVGNPLSSAATPWQFLAQPWGQWGQFLVPGAGNWLIRTLSYFPDADTTGHWWILAGWALLGIVLAVAGHFRGQAAVTPVPGTTDSIPVVASAADADDLHDRRSYRRTHPDA